MLRVLIVDDHAILRQGLRSLLVDAFEGVHCGEAGSAAEALEQLAKQEWDVALLDITMPGKSGLELLRELKALWPKLPVIMLSAHPEDQFAVRARKAGAQGYMTKESAPEELVNAIRVVMAGGHLSPALNPVAAASAPRAASWLLQNGARELEQLLQTVLYRSVTPVLILDDERTCRHASFGATRLLGLRGEEIIGRSLDDLVMPSFKREISALWNNILRQAEPKGTLTLPAPLLPGSLLPDPNAGAREVDYTARAHMLPARHLLFLQDDTGNQIPPWVLDEALFLLNLKGDIVAWYSGAERMYGYAQDEVTGRHVALLFSAEDTLLARLQEELDRAQGAGHSVSEGWRMRKDGSRFWANAVTMALRNENGDLQGFARMVRDFTLRREADQALLRARALTRPLPVEAALTGMVSGEFDQIQEVNDVFLDLMGYSQEDVQSGRLQWLGLDPPEFVPVAELAHEECLRYGACTPFETEMIRKDGTRVPVLRTTAILNLVPFRWVSFIHISGRGVVTKMDDEPVGELTNHFEEIVGRSPALKRLLGQIEVVAPTAATVLILGETGTGKELVARAVHRLSPRRERTFISLNCAAIPTGLLESELFGYERGAFTGALSQKIGRFEMAHKGTLFLDEVGDIPLDLQPKLLRALQEKAFERLGGTKTIPIDVRLVAATNRNLAQMMGEKLFRSDLYYRLKVFPITTPPLRDHPEDIPLLARRVGEATTWLRTAGLGPGRIAYFGASTGAAAALWAAANPHADIAAVVSRGGRPDLAQPHLGEVTAPTLLIVGSRDHEVLSLNRAALAHLGGEAQLAVVRGASHLFEEPGTLPAAADLARDWFLDHLGSADLHSRREDS